MPLQIFSLLIALISAIATVAAAMIYRNTLKELKKQTLNAHMPILSVMDESFYSIGVVKNGIVMPQIWANTSLPTFEFSKDVYVKNSFRLKCHNIGAGAAFKLSVTFKFDFDAFMETINTLGNIMLEAEKFTLKKKDWFIGIYPPANSQLPYIARRFSTEVPNKSNHLLSTSMTDKPFLIFLPPAFTELSNIYFYYLTKINPWPPLDIPDLTMTISYKDKLNQSLSSVFNIKTDLALVGDSCAGTILVSYT